MLNCNKIFLAYREEELLPYAFAYLRSQYPRWEGWDLHYNHNDEALSPDFIIERHQEGITYRAAVEVKSSGWITTAHIRKLNNYAKILANHSRCVIEKIFIVPSDCDTSLVPNDIKIIYLKEF